MSELVKQYIELLKKLDRAYELTREMSTAELLIDETDKMTLRVIGNLTGFPSQIESDKYIILADMDEVWARMSDEDKKELRVERSKRKLVDPVPRGDRSHPVVIQEEQTT